MKKNLLVLLSLIVLAGMAAAQQQLPIPVSYWIIGELANVSGVNANGIKVDFYAADEQILNNPLAVYAQAVVVNNRFLINAFDIWPTAPVVGREYRVAAEQKNGYGASAAVTISGVGYDQVQNFQLVAGGGLAGSPLSNPKAGPGTLPTPVVEPAPVLKFWFGNRVYQKELVAKGKKFVVSDKPDVRVEVAIEEPYVLSSNIAEYALVLDPDTPSAKNFTLGASHMTQKIFTSGTQNIRSFSLDYTVSEKIAEGEHRFKVSASSSGTQGIAAQATQFATVEVMGGPLRIVDIPITYPSPFRIQAHGTVYIQYTLSADAAIDIYITDVGGSRIKRFLCESGTEGGSAGLNKVSWDGMTAMGVRAGNAIYVGTIVARQEGRLLGKFKLTVID